MTSTEPMVHVTYRELRQTDLDAVAGLFDLAGWGPVPTETLHEWYFSDLDPVVAVAANDRDEARGIMAFFPYRVQLFDRVGIAYRGRGAVLAPELRYSTRQPTDAEDSADPFTGMGVYAIERIAERRGAFVFGLPHQRVRTRQARREAEKGSVSDPAESDGSNSEHEFGALKFDLTEQPTRRLPLDVTPTLGPFGSDYDALWDRARPGLGIQCSVARDADGLTRIRRSRAHDPRMELRLECRPRARSELVGYTIVRDETEGQLLDILALDDTALHEVATSIVNWLRAHQDSVSTQFLSSIAHSTYAQALRDAGAGEIDWPFALQIYAMDPEPRPELDAARWYVTTGD
jgi:hypothetical protein